MIEIVRLNESHFEMYRALMLEAYQLSPDAYTSTATEREALPDSWWCERLGSRNGGFYTVGAIESHTLVGAVGLEFNDRIKTKHKARLVGMYVTPHSRGKGIGRKLLDRVISVAGESARVEVILLTVTDGNDGAVKLYQAAGFEVFGVEPRAIYTNGAYLAKQHMWLSIAGS